MFAICLKLCAKNVVDQLMLRPGAEANDVLKPGEIGELVQDGFFIFLFFHLLVIYAATFNNISPVYLILEYSFMNSFKQSYLFIIDHFSRFIICFR